MDLSLSDDMFIAWKQCIFKKTREHEHPLCLRANIVQVRDHVLHEQWVWIKKTNFRGNVAYWLTNSNQSSYFFLVATGKSE